MVFATQRSRKKSNLEARQGMAHLSALISSAELDRWTELSRYLLVSSGVFAHNAGTAAVLQLRAESYYVGASDQNIWHRKSAISRNQTYVKEL